MKIKIKNRSHRCNINRLSRPSEAPFKDQFMKKSNNTEAELKKRAAYKKSA